MKKQLLLLPALLLFLFSSTAQPTISFQRSYGGTGSDWALAVDRTADGGCVMSGWTGSADGDVTLNNGGFDCWIVKLDSSNTVQWQKSLGGSQTDIAYSIDQTSDGGYIVGALAYSNDGDVVGHHAGNSGDFWIVKLDSAGTIDWQRCLGGSGDDEPFSIQQTSDGGYIVAGYTLSIDGDVTGLHGSNDYWVVKLDGTGNIQWQRALGGSQMDQAFFVRQTQDGGYIVTGNSNSNNGDVSGHHGSTSVFDYWVVKLNSSGIIVWQTSLGGTADDESWGIVQANDLGYVVTGFSSSVDGDVSGNHGSDDVWVVKLNPTGGIEWQKSYGGSSRDQGWAVSKSPDGGFVIAGLSNSNNFDVSGNHGSYDQWILKTDPTGVLEWQKSIGGPGDDAAYALALNTTGGCAVVGRSQTNGGDVTNNHGDYDCWLVRLNNVFNGVETLTLKDLITVYPNPSHGDVTVSVPAENRDYELWIYDPFGKLVNSSTLKPGINPLRIDDLAHGLYFFRVGVSGSYFTTRLVVE